MHNYSDRMFNGRSLLKFVDIIKAYLEKNKCQSVLDYGCGKGALYTEDFHTITNVYAGTQSLEGFKNLLIYFFAFLGSALSFDNMYVAVGLGVILSSYLCFLTWEKYFTKNPTVYAFMVYIFFIAALVAIARSDLGVENVFSPRYKIDSVILTIMVYMSLAERFSLASDNCRNFVICGILIAAISYFVSFKPGKFSLETRSKSLVWLANQWGNTNHGFYFSPGEPGAHDRIANSKLLRAIEGRFYKLPHKILNIPDSLSSCSASSIFALIFQVASYFGLLG